MYLHVLFLVLVFSQSARLEAANDSVVDDGFIKIAENETDAVPQQTFKEAEKEITDFVNSLLRSILPKIVGGSGDAKLSPQCTAGMMKIFGYVRRMKGWTIKRSGDHNLYVAAVESTGHSHEHGTDVS
ncbi:NRF domain-containing protein [Trichonephila clavipes]|nr:NRF domain-containing protein [Trichonephila clavipes]